ncbi:hypothetical protein G9F32_00005 [Acinetobacter sp. 194]|uniref:hypothetical protein n=1 Tax=Acinetobacter shaoyimingii TaxID=2715164 RepID=UPI0014076A25|nr:hypothetical protein [Acinetobacter shaoyimingii]NHB56419.1 hypothetical protein [Acinetobacter shaoyimingii]
MTTDDKKSSTAKTTTEGNQVTQKITRKVQIFLLFWVAEKDKAKNLFQEAAQTRNIILKTEPWYDPLIHKVHLPDITNFSSIQKAIDYWVNFYGGETKAAVKEVSFFSHAATQGPLIYNAYQFDPKEILILVESGKHQQMLESEWAKLKYYWANGETRLNFFGCNTAKLDAKTKNYEKAFARKISAYKNCQNVVVAGQPSSSYPSFLPDLRITAEHIAVHKGIGWDYAPTFMVASEGDNGLKAITTRNAKILTMKFFKNKLRLKDDFQSIFNDYRTTRNSAKTPELAKVHEWNKLGYRYR